MELIYFGVTDTITSIHIEKDKVIHINKELAKELMTSEPKYQIPKEFDNILFELSNRDEVEFEYDLD